MKTSSHSAGRRRFLRVVVSSAGVTALTAAAQSFVPGDRRMMVITTPTGKIGRQVLEKVVESGVHVRVIARDAARLPTQIAKRVEIVQGSHGDARVVEDAFRGADTVFWVCPPDPRAASVEAAYLEFTRPACDAIRKHGVRRVVGISALGRGLPIAKNAGHVTASLAMDDMIANTGVSFRALTMPSFMDNMARQVTSIKRQGVFFSPISGDRKLPSCATRDIAAVAARLLLDPSWSGQGSVPILGPEDLSFNDMARIMSEVLETPVRFHQTDPATYKAQLMNSGMSEAAAQGMLLMASAKNNGLDNAEPRTPASTSPTTFRQWCTEELKPIMRSST